MSSPCQLLEWDTDFFGFRIARVSNNRLTTNLIREINIWCLENNIKCVYFLAPSDHAETIRLAEENGFRLMDVRITFEFFCSDIDETSIESNPKTLIRSVVPEDINPLKNISRDIFNSTRFYFDTNFPRKKVRAMYEVWLEKSCKGFADSVFVVEIEKHLIGYITCHIAEDKKSGKVGLIGIGQGYQGGGIGGDLIKYALKWFSRSHVRKVTVVTQGRNIAAQRLFEGCGFQIRELGLWFHKWFADEGSHE